MSNSARKIHNKNYNHRATGRRNANGERCKCYLRTSVEKPICTCEWKSVSSTKSQPSHIRARHNADIVKVNKRIAAYAKHIGIPLPYKLRSRRSRVYRTIDNELSGRVQYHLPVDVIYTTSGAVMAADINIDFWGGDGTRWNVSPTGRMTDRIVDEIATAIAQGKDERLRAARSDAEYNAIARSLPKVFSARRYEPIAAPCLQWLESGCAGECPR